MSEFFATLWSEIQDLLSFFVTVALLQNVILITGFGSSVMLHMVKKPKKIWLQPTKNSLISLARTPQVILIGLRAGNR